MKKLSDIVTPEEFRLCDATSEEIKLSREFMQEWKPYIRGFAIGFARETGMGELVGENNAVFGLVLLLRIQRALIVKMRAMEP